MRDERSIIMAIDNTKKNYAFMEFPLSMSRQDAFPLDRSSVFYALEEAESYAQSDPTAYVGQVISVVTDGIGTAYQIKNSQGELEKLEGESRVATDEEVDEMLDEIF